MKDLKERLMRESQRLFPERMRDGHAHHATAFALDRAAEAITQLEAEIAALRSGLRDLLTATQPQHTLHHVYLSEAQEAAAALLDQPK